MAKKKDQQYEDYIENFSKLADMYNQSLNKSLENVEDAELPFSNIYNPELFSQMIGKVIENPEKLYKQQLELCSNYIKVWNNAWGRYIGEEENPLYQEDPKDRRFQDETWDRDAIFDFIKQSYLLTNNWLQNVIGDIEGVDQKTLEKFEFCTKQFIDAMSPSNFAFTNPQVIRETIDTNGENLVKGFNNLMRDLENSKQYLYVQTADKKAFKLGQNIAKTAGAVIYKNELMELIQYDPVCKQTYQRPLLLIPAWINKYYIFDLSDHNSFVKWACEQGYTVFVISWVNPGKKLAHKKFENYMLQGPIEALDAIKAATGEENVTAIGYCLGGTMLAATLAYMQTKNDDRIKAAAFLTTMVDFSNVGDMAVFIDEQQIDKIDKQMQEVGFLDSSEIAAIFSVMRANDLIWSFVVNNYLMGKDPLPFDILYWNADATRLPADTHSFYLRNMYLKNLFKKPGGIILDNIPIDVTKVKTPSYILSTKEDHIAPWQTTYETTKLFKGKTRFVLAGSGHVAGVINHPDKKKYNYWTNDTNSKSPNTWFKAATEKKGSWWTDWHKWNKALSGNKVTAPKPGSGKLKTIKTAPGSYVKVKDS